MQIRKANSSDIDLLIDNRLEFVCSIKNIADPHQFRESTKLYIQRHFDDDSLISYIALDDDTIVASCILCIYETLPTPDCLNGKCGLLLNVYTLINYRRQGLALELLKRLIEEAKQLGVGKIQLDYTQDGYPLYVKLGFKKSDKEMALNLINHQ